MPKPQLIARARRLRRDSGGAERAVWKIVRDRRLAAFKFRRQHPIDPFIVDFACVAAKLVVEVDGLSHGIAEQAAFDAERTRILESQGWRVIRASDSLALSDESGTFARIAVVLDERLPEMSAPPPHPALSPLSGGEG